MDIYPDWYRLQIEYRKAYEEKVRNIAFQQAMGQRMNNPEPDNKNLVPITDAEAYRAMDAVSRIERLTDMGINPPTKWKLDGQCRFNGLQVHTVETVNQQPDQREVYCWDCVANNVHRLVLVIEVAASTE